MDGNGRWATNRGLPRVAGHKKGAKVLEKITEYAFSLGIKVVSVFAFSTENWQRPKSEVDAIFDLLRDFIKKFDASKNSIKSKVKLHISGDLTKLPLDLQESIREKIEQTKNNSCGTLNVALNYGGKDDIVQACNNLLKKKVEFVDEKAFEKELYSHDLPPLDFVIRTGGDMRLSNFMLYQLAYAELYFTKTYWPSFTSKQLDNALIDFASRKRKFGNI